MSLIGTAVLRTLNAEFLRELQEPIIIQRGSERLAVLVPYKLFIEMQEMIIKKLRWEATVSE